MKGSGGKALAVVVIFATSGCVMVPKLTETANIHVNEVAKRIKCDLIKAVHTKVLEDPRKFGFLSQWSAKVHLTVAVDGTTSVNPGVSFIEPLGSGTSRSLSVGVGLQTEAIRTEDIEFFLSFPDVISEFRNLSPEQAIARYNGCQFESGFFLQSDLDIKSMLDRALSPVAEGVLYTGKNVPLPGGPAPIPTGDAERIRQTIQQLRTTPSLPEPKEKEFQLTPELTQQFQNQATRIERNAEAIIRNVVSPLYEIASSSLVGRQCLSNISKARYSAVTSSAVVSIRKTEVDAAQSLPLLQQALAEMQVAELDVVSYAKSMAREIYNCAQQPKPAEKKKIIAYDPIDLVSETVNFYVTYSGSLTPAWKLVRLTAPIAPNFLSGSRKDTNTLILVMGRPVSTDENGPAPSRAMDNQLLSSLLRDAITQRPFSSQ